MYHATILQVVNAFKLSLTLKKMNTAEVACNSFVDFFMGLNPKFESPAESDPKEREGRSSPSDTTDRGFANSLGTLVPLSSPSGTAPDTL